MKNRLRDYRKALLALAVLLVPILIQGGLLQPRDAMGASISCSSGVSDCHFKGAILDGTGRNLAAGLFQGTHARHSGYSTARRQYQFACTKCHPSGSYTNNHQSGFKNITGSSLPGNRYSAGKKIANTNSPTFGNCSNIYCHSTGRATGMGMVQYSSARWAGTKTCLGCHGGRTSANGTPARSLGNFTLSTTHSQHLKYPAANMNCQICHSKTATDAATLKNFSGVVKHANGVRNVTFTAVSYGSYTSYKSTEVGSSGNTKKCGNLSCHGGTTRSAWSAATTNNDHTCLHCHGVAGTTTLRADKYNAAPGWAGSGTSTDQISVDTNIRVGAHYGHLSSVYLKKLKCNECHTVPANPFDGTHMATLRYNSQTLTFSQASTAIKNTTTPAKTDGTPVAAATCTTTYCHGSNMPRGDTSGTARSPQWNQSTLMTRTPGADCGTCHGNPPTAGTTATDHSGVTATTGCVTCHGMVVSGTGAVINKSLHMNGTIEVVTDCNGCHAYDLTGGGTTWTPALSGGSGTGSHIKHIAFIKSRLSIVSLTPTGQTFGAGEPAGVCGTCHTNTLSEHKNGSRQITFGAGGTTNTMGAGYGGSMSLLFGGSNPSFNGVAKTCSNVLCHYFTTPNWY